MVVVVTHHRIVGRINEDSVRVMLLAQCQMEYHFLISFVYFVCVCVHMHVLWYIYGSQRVTCEN